MTEALRNEPKQSRAQARVDSILAASRQHYKDVGRDRFNTDGVASLAGCSIGTIYRYFDDRVAILDVIEPNRDRHEGTLAAARKVLTRKLTDEEKLLTLTELLR